MTPSPAPEAVRPRVEGDRENEILDACVEELLETGYDRMTMDAVAKRARASKATLYRRWETKPALVVEAVLMSKHTGHDQPPDTGTLRGDLLAAFTDAHGMAPARNLRLMGQVMPAMQTDEAFAAEFRERFLNKKLAAMATIYARAGARGELDPEVDVELLGPALAGILLHRAFVMGEPITRELIERVLDHIILPAATARRSGRPDSPLPSPTQEPS